jgi:hypothetical protein
MFQHSIKHSFHSVIWLHVNKFKLQLLNIRSDGITEQIEFFWLSWWATKKLLAGLMWPVDSYLTTPDLAPLPLTYVPDCHFLSLNVWLSLLHSEDTLIANSLLHVRGITEEFCMHLLVTDRNWSFGALLERILELIKAILNVQTSYVTISQIIYQQSQLKDVLLVLLFYNCITTCFGLHGPSSGEYNILPCLLTSSKSHCYLNGSVVLSLFLLYRRQAGVILHWTLH